MKRAHVHTSLYAFYKNRFPALWNIAAIVNGCSCSPLSNLHHLTFFFFLTFSFRLLKALEVSVTS